MPFIGNPPVPPRILNFTAMEDLLSAPSPKVEGTLAKVRRYYGNYTAFDGTPQLNYQVGDFLGGGLFYWTGESLAFDNFLAFPAATGGTWVRVIESGQPFDMRWSGAYGNGLNDDSLNIVNAFIVMDRSINSPPTSFLDLYAKIGNTIFFPAGSYYLANAHTYTFLGKVVGHQYFNSNCQLSSKIIPSTTTVFVCQEFRNLNIETQGSASPNIEIEAVNVSGCYFKEPIVIYPHRNPYPSGTTQGGIDGAVTIQGCQFLNTSPFSLSIQRGYTGNTHIIINGSVFQGGIELEADITDLVINACYVMNSSGDYVPGIPPVNLNGNSIYAMSPSTKAITLTSGTSATNPAYLLTATIRIPVTLSPTSTAAATVSVAITDQYGNTTTTTMASAPAGSTMGIVQTINFDVPPQASYTVTATNATLGEGTISYNTTAVSLNATSVSLS